MYPIDDIILTFHLSFSSKIGDHIVYIAIEAFVR